MNMLASISMMDLTKVCLIIFVFVVVITILIVISSLDFKKKNKKKEDNNINFEDLKKQVNQIKENKNCDVLEKIKEKSQFSDETIKKEEVKEHVNLINPVIESKEAPKASLDDILSKLEEDITSEKTSAHSFEELQEEKAIISYKELLKVAGKLKVENEGYNDEIENTRSYKFPELKEINKIEEEIKENKSKETFREEIYDQPKEVKLSETPKINEVKKFKSSDIISPVYGKVKIEETNEESEFLKKLKDLRSNLK